MDTIYLRNRSKVILKEQKTFASFTCHPVGLNRVFYLLVYKEAFLMYDKNGDSKITLDEFGDVIKNLGLTPSDDQLSQLMKEIDLDGRGFFLPWTL